MYSWKDFKKYILCPEILAAVVALVAVFLLYFCLPAAIIILILKVVIYGL